MLHRAVGGDDSVFEIPVLGLMRRPLDEAPHAVAVVGVGSQENEVDGRERRSIQGEDAMGFVGPDDLTAGGGPPPAPPGAQPPWPPAGGPPPPVIPPETRT